MDEQRNQNINMNTNPVFKKVYNDTIHEGGYGASYKGIIIKAAIMFATLVVTAIGSLFLPTTNLGLYVGLLIGSLIMGSVSVFIASFSVRLAPTFSFIYVIAEGFILGFISALFEMVYPGIVTLAVLITLGIFAGMLVLYSTKLIIVTSRFRKVMLGVSIGILFSMFFIGIFSLFDGGALWANTFGGNGPVALLVSLLLIVYGSFMLVMSFDNARLIVASGVDKRYEWQVSLGLMVSTVYIYVQVLRLLVILMSRRD